MTEEQIRRYLIKNAHLKRELQEFNDRVNDSLQHPPQGEIVTSWRVVSKMISRKRTVNRKFNNSLIVYVKKSVSRIKSVYLIKSL